MSKLMSEGWHRANAVDFGIAVTDGGTESIAILLQIVPGDTSGDEGRVISTNLYCTEAAIMNTLDALRIFGWTGTNLAEFESSEVRKVESLLPNEVSFFVKIEEYDGKQYSKVGKICRASSGKVIIKNRIEGNAARDFGARFRAACSAVPANGGQPTVSNNPPVQRPSPAQRAPVNRPAEPAQSPDDEYPF